MVFNSILHPLPSTHAHTHTHKHRSNSNTNSTHASPPQPGNLPHASTLPPTLDTHNHKHYHPHQAGPHHSNATNNSNHHTLNPATYISKHHQEYTLQHSFKSAKHAARTSIDTAMPDFSPPISKTSTTTSTSATSSTPTSANPLTSEPATLSPEDRARLEQAEAEAAERQHEQDQEAWQKIVSAREAAARRRTIGEEDERPQMEPEWRGMSEGSVRTEGSRD